jgi:hypothetical protein
MAGNEADFFHYIDESYQEPFVYFEIGIASGETLFAVDDHLKDKERTLIGVDVPASTTIGRENVTVLRIGSETFFDQIKQKANFIFIDACHGYDCVKRDFLGAEQHIKPGGIICFHDADEACQGIHPQHCGKGIQVREVLTDLGLLDNKREGWQLLKETTGDKNRGGHGCAFFQYKL